MSTWTHSICESCWRLRHGVNRMPARSISHTPRACCFCELPTNGGIFVREDPDHPDLYCNQQPDYHDALVVNRRIGGERR